MTRNKYVSNQGEFQDPKMEVLYHIRPYFGGISPYIALTLCLIYGIGTSNKSVHEMASEAILKTHLVHGKDIHKFGKVPSLTTRLYNNDIW